MSSEQQLLERTTAPGDSYWYKGACIRRPYSPVNKDSWTWEMAMASDDTPDIAARRNVRQTSFLVLLGRHGVGSVMHG